METGSTESGGGDARLQDRVKRSFRTKIIAGIAVLVPVVVTFQVLRLVFLWLDGFAQPMIKRIFNKEDDLPGLGIVLTITVVWLAGALASNVFGRRMIRRGERVLERIPIIGNIYSPVKQFIETVVKHGKQGSFSQVVLAEYPSEGLWILGFATGEVRLDNEGKVGRCVFVPTSPNPATGWMVICPPEKVRDTPLTMEEAMRLIVSGGIVVPESLKNLGTYGSEAAQDPVSPAPAKVPEAGPHPSRAQPRGGPARQSVERNPSLAARPPTQQKGR